MKKNLLSTASLVAVCLGISFAAAQIQTPVGAAHQELTQLAPERPGGLSQAYLVQATTRPRLTRTQSQHSKAGAGFLIRVPQDYATIQGAIDAAADGDTVLVAEGTYFENINFRGKAIIVASTYLTTGDTSRISHTIINGSKPKTTDSASVVSFVSGEDTTSILCGFTITGGMGTHVFHVWGGETQEGGGVLCFNSGARLIRNIIRGNILTDAPAARPFLIGAGISVVDETQMSLTSIIDTNLIAENITTAVSSAVGGIGISSSGGNVIIRKNVITDNIGQTASASQWASGGGIYVAGGAAYCDSNLIARNKALAPNQTAWTPLGGGVAAEDASLDFRHNIVTDNVVQSASSAWGGGLCAFANNAAGSREVIISGNYFGTNQALGATGSRGGGIHISNQKPRLENNIVVGNAASMGGGISIYGTLSSRVVVVNNTVYDNSSTYDGGLSLHGGATAVVFNNIFWADSAATNPEIGGGTNAYVRYCDVQGGWPADPTNLGEDPQFLDEYFHIGIMSPCWEAGTDTVRYGGILYQAPTTSYEPGIPRPFPLGTKPDIGAVEGFIDGGITVATLPSACVLEQNYPNPFNPSTVIGYRLPSAANVRLVVYDLLGREVGVLVDERKQVGSYEVTFDAAGLSSGIYFYRLTAGSYAQCRKMILVR